MKKAKYIGKFIKVETYYISNETGERVESTFEERSLDYFQGTNKFSLVETCEHVASAKGRTQKEVIEAHFQFLDAAPIANYQLFFVTI